MSKTIRCLALLAILILSLDANATNPVIRDIGTGIELRNNWASIVISYDAELLSITDLDNNTDIADKKKKRIAYVKTTAGSIVEASGVTLEGEKLVIKIGNNKVQLTTRAYNDFFSFEVQNESLKGVESLTFIDLALNTNVQSAGSFCATGVAMSLQTNPVDYPSCENKEVVGLCYNLTGFQGAKLAIVACPKDRLWGIVKSVYHSVPVNTIPVLSNGGPFAHDGESNRHDCVIVSGADVDPANIPEWIVLYSKIGIRQISFHVGQSTFIQGRFDFPNYGSAKKFKEQITDPLNKAGIISTLHTYAYYINYSSDELLSNPKWQQQLEFRGEYKLTKTISAEEDVIDVLGDLTSVNTGSGSSVHTPYLLIDKEIIKYEVGKNGFTACKRGQCGTTATSHAKGTKAKIIGGYFNYMAPQIGSDLFYEIARRTATAYNEGGFRGLYIDALDGLRIHLKYAGLSDYLWYYGAAFINEILRHCKTEPLVVEYSTMNPTLWSARGRGESWDTPCRGYKNFIDEHITRNLYLMNRNYHGILGWYNFYPVLSSEPGGFSTKYMFSDDVDYMGVNALAYDQTMVYNGLYKRNVDKIPGLKRNLERYAIYNKLRTENYFSDRVKTILKEGEYEYKLDRKRGVWGFYEAKYCRTKLCDIKIDKIDGVNPFNEQKPFIRLENLYSSDGSTAINLMQFENNIELKDWKKEKAFPKSLDLSKHMGLKIRVMGCSTGAKDALCIRLLPENQSGYADYIICLNFDGWRDVVLSCLDNAEYPDLKFYYMDDERYNMHRNPIDFSHISKIQVFRSSENKGVRIQKIDAVPIINNPISNPTVHLGNASVKFLDTIQSGEYVEYNTGKKTASVYDRLGNSRSIKVKRIRTLRVPNGAFTATVSGVSPQNNVPAEMIVTFGLYGSFIRN